MRDGRSGGAVASAITALRILALDAYQEGRWTAAEDLATEALEACADRGLPLLAAPARWCLALVAAARGDDAVVGALTDELTAWGVPRGARQLVVHAGQARALAALGRGDFEDAWREATAPGPPGLREPRGPALWATLDVVEAAVRTHRFPEARAHVAAVRAALTPAHNPRLALLAAGATAMAASDDRAGALYEAAFALPDAQRWPFDLARLRLAHGEQLRRARSTTAAREQLLLALDTFTDLGARPWVARASTELRAAGHATDRGPGGPRRAGQPSLTAQEREVAGLAASGMTNRQIADRLHLSRRTVDAHLYRVFPKLDITGRAALRDALDRLGDRPASAGHDTDVPPEPAAQPGIPRSDSPDPAARDPKAEPRGARHDIRAHHRDHRRRRRPLDHPQAHRAPARALDHPRPRDRPGAHRDPLRRRVRLALPPGRGGRLHRGRHRRDEIQDRPTITLRTGEGFLIPPRTPHNALDLGPDTGRMLSTYIVEIGEPLTTLVDAPQT